MRWPLHFNGKEPCRLRTRCIRYTGDMTIDEAMSCALDLAWEAAGDGDVPVGAVVLDPNGRIIGRGRNCRETHDDPLAHAEVLAMRDAAVRLRGDNMTPDGADSVRHSWNLSNCTLVVTLEPCPMCAGACLQTHVGRIVFGAWDAKLGACGSVWDIPRDPHIGHSPEVIGGVHERACARLLADFFAERRY